MPSDEQGKIVEERLQKLREKRESLSRKIRMEQSKISKQVRKERTRTLIQLGGLVETAGLSQVDLGVLLGALMEITSVINTNSEQIEIWKYQGDQILKERNKKAKNC